MATYQSGFTHNHPEHGLVLVAGSRVRGVVVEKFGPGIERHFIQNQQYFVKPLDRETAERILPEILAKERQSDQNVRKAGEEIRQQRLVEKLARQRMPLDGRARIHPTRDSPE